MDTLSAAEKSEVVRQGALSAEAQMPFWLQLVGNGLTTTWAAHLGAVLTHVNLAHNKLHQHLQRASPEKADRRWWWAGISKSPMDLGWVLRWTRTLSKNTGFLRSGWTALRNMENRFIHCRTSSRRLSIQTVAASTWSTKGLDTSTQVTDRPMWRV